MKFCTFSSFRNNFLYFIVIGVFRDTTEKGKGEYDNSKFHECYKWRITFYVLAMVVYLENFSPTFAQIPN